MKNFFLILALSIGAFAQSFPTSVFTPLIARDNIQTTLATAMAAGDSVAVVSSGTGWAANMVAYICDASTSTTKCTGTFEAMLVTGVAGPVLTVTRSYGGTSAVAHASGRTVSNAPVAVYNTSLNNEVHAIEVALGANLSNIPASPVYSAASYNFVAQTPGGSLTAGSRTITLTPCPLGVNGTDTSHYFYLSGGTGTAEAALLTGGTCTSGATTGNVTLTVAASHSGAWTISSATGGVAEAHQAIVSATGFGTVALTAAATFYQGVYASNSAERIVFQGQGPDAQLIVRSNTTYPAGDLLHNAASASWEIRDLGVLNPGGTSTTGSSIYIGPGQVRIDHVGIYNGQYGIRFVGAVSSSINDTWYVNTDMTFKAVAGLSLESLCLDIAVSNSYFVGSPVTNANVLTRGMQVLAADGVLVTNTILSGDTGLLISPASNYIANLRFDQVFIDQVRNFGVSFSGAGFVINNIRFTGGHIHGQSNGTTSGLSPMVYIDPTVTGGLEEVSFSNTLIAGGAVEGVQVLATGMKNLTFSGVSIVDNNRSNTALLAGVKIATGATGVSITGSTIGNTLGSGHQKFAITTLGTLTGNISGNNLLNNETSPLSIGGVLTGVLENNQGVTEVIPAVASAASIALPTNPIFTISGSTGVTAVTAQRPGMRGSFTATAGAVAFTSGASIGNTFVAAQNVPVNFYSDGTKVWLSSQSPGVTFSGPNYIASETGANNAIAGALTGVSVADGLCVTVQLAHTLQAGADTFALNGGSAVAIKSHLNTANNIGTAYAATGRWTGCYNTTGPVWLDVGQ